MTRGRARALLQPALGVAEERDQLVADDLDDLLARREALQDRLIHRAIADAIDEGLDDLEVDVGLEQRHPDFAEGGLHRRLGQAGFALEGLKDVLEAIAEGVEHGRPRRQRSAACAAGYAAGQTLIRLARS